MVHVVYGEALGNFNDPISMLDFLSLHLTKSTATFGRAVDDAGVGIGFTGSGLTYGDNGTGKTSVTGGTMTSVNFFDASGASLVRFTGAQYDALAVTVNVAVDQDGSVLFAGNDLVEGSTKRDIVAGAGGNDTLHGGDGSDVIVAMGGKDLLYGDKGADFFAFTPNKVQDKIMDFADHDLKSDDLIVTSKALYGSMTMSQQNHDVLLDFGAKGSLLIVGALVEDIGRDDFTFSLPFLG